MRSAPNVILATNEPWGTYHAVPLLDDAAALGISLSQWCPSRERVPAGTRVAVVTDCDALRRADLVVVNGLVSEHTHEASALAQCAGVPLAFVELAYLSARAPERKLMSARPELDFWLSQQCPSPGCAPASLGDQVSALAPDWKLVSACSEASVPAVAANAVVPESAVEVLGWPGLDHLPAWCPVPRRLLALTSVSEPTPTGGHLAEPHELLYGALEACERAGWDVVVRPHPRENPARWSRWTLDDHARVEAALAGAQAVIGIPGTSTPVAAVMGVPYVSVPCAQQPAHLHRLTTPLADPSDAPALLAGARPAAPELVRCSCGPVGGAARRICERLLRSLD